MALFFRGVSCLSLIHISSAKKDYESTLKKPSGVKVSAGERQEDRAHAALLALETELRTLEKH